MAEKQRSCAERVEQEWNDRREYLAELLERINEGDDEASDELMEFGVSVEYVIAGTYTDQPEGFYRWQFGTGGSQDELRFFSNGSTEFWFLDWWDGAHINVTGDEVAEYLRVTALELLGVDWDKVAEDDAEYTREKSMEAIGEAVDALEEARDALENMINSVQGLELGNAYMELDDIRGYLKKAEEVMDTIEE
jgi:hypothetical protein